MPWSRTTGACNGSIACCSAMPAPNGVRVAGPWHSNSSNDPKRRHLVLCSASQQVAEVSKALRKEIEKDAPQKKKSKLYTRILFVVVYGFMKFSCLKSI